MNEWFQLAASPDVVKRAFLTAAIVGVILIGINHGDALLRGDVDGSRLLKMVLTFLVPYAVSTSSAVSALRGEKVDDARS